MLLRNKKGINMSNFHRCLSIFCYVWSIYCFSLKETQLGILVLVFAGLQTILAELIGIKEKL